MSPKRNDRVAPPPHSDGWDFKFATNDAAKGWEELCQQVAANLRRAYDAITADPAPVAGSRRQHRLERDLAEREHKGRLLPQWQYEVTGGGRLWYLVDAGRREIWLTHAGPAHPKRTE